jgi:hypothetical protein
MLVVLMVLLLHFIFDIHQSTLLNGYSMLKMVVQIALPVKSFVMSWLRLLLILPHRTADIILLNGMLQQSFLIIQQVVHGRMPTLFT